MKVKVNDTFNAGNIHFKEVFDKYSGPEPEYVPPKIWPHQVPLEKRWKK